jgi:hypothetical protein
MDVRNYPRGTMYQFAVLNPNPPVREFTSIDSTGPVRWFFRAPGRP